MKSIKKWVYFIPNMWKSFPKLGNFVDISRFVKTGGRQLKFWFDNWEKK